MQPVLQFIHDNPRMSVFIILVMAGTLVGIVHYIAIMIRGYNPYMNEEEDETEEEL